MLKTTKYRLRPTKNQRDILAAQLEECRGLYNHFLEQRKRRWEEEQYSLTYHAQAITLPQLKERCPELSLIHSQVLQNVAVRVDLAFKAFFRRVKAGEDPGYPRFRSSGRYDSMTFPQYGNGCQLVDGMLKISKVGTVRVIQHRDLEGTPKTCTIRRASTGKWYGTITCEVEAQPLPATGEDVGIDVGLLSFATLSTGQSTACPKFLRTDEKDLKRTQRKLASAEKGTTAQAKRRKIVARVHERIANRRSNFAHQESRRLVNRFDMIAIEDLSVNRLVHNHCLAKSIHDAAWSQFATFLAYKAAWAGRTFVAVNPAYTSQDCSGCGHRQQKTLAERVHKCACCGLTLDRDHNAALNILSLGLQALGLSLKAPAFTPGE
jgi:putative transposase